MDNDQKRYVFLGVLLAGCIATSFFSEKFGVQTEKSLPAIPHKLVESRENAKQNSKMKIYVSGAVLEPGVYDVPYGSRAQDAIAIAGGLRQDADLERVNLARKLKDGMQVNVPAIKNRQKASAASRNTAKTVNGKGTEQTNREDRSQSFPSQGKINLNTASAAELERLPGIGPAMAQRILAARTQQNFSSVEDLKRVKGIGTAKLAQLRDYVEVR